jgi:hypothetical protein
MSHHYIYISKTLVMKEMEKVENREDLDLDCTLNLHLSQSNDGKRKTHP